MARIKLEFDLDDLVNDGKITVEDMVECLFDDKTWAAVGGDGGNDGNV